MEIKVRLLNFRRGLWKEKQTAPVGRNSEGMSKEQRSSEFHVQEDTEAIPLHGDKVFHFAQMQLPLDTKRRTISTTVSVMPGRGGGQD